MSGCSAQVALRFHTHHNSGTPQKSSCFSICNTGRLTPGCSAVLCFYVPPARFPTSHNLTAVGIRAFCHWLGQGPLPLWLLFPALQISTDILEVPPMHFSPASVIFVTDCVWCSWERTGVLKSFNVSSHCYTPCKLLGMSWELEDTPLFHLRTFLASSSYGGGRELQFSTDGRQHPCFQYARFFLKLTDTILQVTLVA